MRKFIIILFAFFAVILAQRKKKNDTEPTDTTKMVCKDVRRTKKYSCVWYTNDSCCLRDKRTIRKKNRTQKCKRLSKEIKCEGKLTFQEKFNIEKKLKKRTKRNKTQIEVPIMN